MNLMLRKVRQQEYEEGLVRTNGSGLGKGNANRPSDVVTLTAQGKALGAITNHGDTDRRKTAVAVAGYVASFERFLRSQGCSFGRVRARVETGLENPKAEACTTIMVRVRC